jgi:hypothetical protein
MNRGISFSVLSPARRTLLRALEPKLSDANAQAGSLELHEANVFQLAQQVRMILRKEFDSAGPVGLHLGNLQSHRGDAGNPGILRLRHFFKPGHIPIGNVRLLHKAENIAHVLDGLLLADGPGVALFANMDFVAVARELFVRPFSLANPAIMSHPCLSLATSSSLNQGNSCIVPRSPSARQFCGLDADTIINRNPDPLL